MNESLYAILGVQPSASVDAVRAAFKRRALAVHPDKGGTAAQFQQVKVAFEKLMHVSRHAEEGSADLTAAMSPSRCWVTHESQYSQTASPRWNIKVTEPPAHFQRHPKHTDRCSHSWQSRATKKDGLVRNSKKPLRPQASRCKVANFEQFNSSYFSRRLCKLLHQLSPERRRAVILERFSELQRLALEQWMLARMGPKSQKAKSHVSRFNDNSSQKHGNGITHELVMGARVRFTEKESIQSTVRAMGVRDRTMEREQRPDGRARSDCQTNVEKQDFDAMHQSILSDKDRIMQRSRPQIDCHTVSRDVHSVTGKRGKATLHLDSSADELIAMIKDSDGQSGSVSQSLGRARIRGIASGVKNGQTWYCASVTLGMIEIMARKVRNLALAIDFLVVVTDIKQQVIAGVTKGLGCKLFEVFFQEVLSTVLADYGLHAEADLGLRFLINVPTKRWIGRNLRTPCFCAANLESGLRALRRLSKARGQVLRGRISALSCNIAEQQTTWNRIRTMYLCFLTELGFSASSAAKKLDALEKAHFPKHQREIERWNCQAMAREESNQRAADRAQRQLQNRERRAMARADAHSRRVLQRMHLDQRNSYRAPFCERQTLKSIDSCLARWVRQAERKAREAHRKKMKARKQGEGRSDDEADSQDTTTQSPRKRMRFLNHASSSIKLSPCKGFDTPEGCSES